MSSLDGATDVAVDRPSGRPVVVLGVPGPPYDAMRLRELLAARR